MAWGLVSLAPDAAPAPADPSVVDRVFANVVVIAAARVVLLAAAGVVLVAAAYVVASTIARMTHGEWLSRAGPFEYTGTDSEGAAVRQLALLDADAARRHAAELARQLAERDGVIVRLREERAALIDRLEDRNGP